MTARTEPRDAMVSALVLDVRGYTAFAHRATAREAIALLSELFAVAIPIVEAHGGRVHQLLGDGVLAFFGVPEALPDHADRAFEAAVELATDVDASLGGRCPIGIGVNSGLVVTGAVTAGRTSELVVIGDPVNVAARVEAATRELGEVVLVTEATRCLLERNAGRLVPRGAIVAKGKPDPLAVYAPAPVAAAAAARRNDFRTTSP